MLWINSPVGKLERKIRIRTGPEIETEIMVIEVLIETPIEIKVDHLVEIGTQDLLVDHLGTGIIRIGIEIETEIEIGIIEGIGAHQMMAMITQDQEMGQELDIILI